MCKNLCKAGAKLEPNCKEKVSAKDKLFFTLKKRLTVKSKEKCSEEPNICKHVDKLSGQKIYSLFLK